MRRRRVVAAAPVRSATTAWATIVELIVDTVDADASIEASGVRREIDRLGAVGPQLVAAGHLEQHPVTLISGTADVDITTASGIAGTTLEENLSRVPARRPPTAGICTSRRPIRSARSSNLRSVPRRTSMSGQHRPHGRLLRRFVDLIDRDALRNLRSSS